MAHQRSCVQWQQWKGLLLWLIQYFREWKTFNSLLTFDVKIKKTDRENWALWSRTAKNSDCSIGPLAGPFARSLAPLTHLPAPDCSLCSRPPLPSLVRLLAHFALSLVLKMTWFCPIVQWLPERHLTCRFCLPLLKTPSRENWNIWHKHGKDRIEFTWKWQRYLRGI